MKSAIEQLKLAEKDLGESCRKCCSMANNCCCYFVSKAFQQAGNGSLFYNGVTVTYCPNAIKWCKTHMAQIPMYLAMPDDVIFFDWNKNKSPDHIGLVRKHKSCDEIYTLEGNTSGGIVDYKTRPAKYVLGIYRPHFVGKYDISKPIEVDGVYGYSSIALTQKWLGVEVDGILGLGTLKTLQKRLKVTADGVWGVGTSKALQKLIGVEADGKFGEDSVKALQRYLNKQVFKTTSTPVTKPVTKPQTPVKPSDKLVVDGEFGKSSIKKAQKYFGTEADGVISGQLKKYANKYKGITADCITYGGGGSSLVKAMQKKLGATADGILGVDTIKHIQKWLGVEVDGIWGKATSRAFQLFLNDPSKNPPKPMTITKPSASKPSASSSWQSKANAWARKIAGEKYHYVRWGSNPKSHTCPICNERKYNNFYGWNCIGFAFAVWHHGGKLGTKCNCGVIDNNGFEKMLKMTTAKAEKYASDRVGKKVKVIKNGGKAIPLSDLKAGDIVLLFKGSKYYHTIYYMGNGKYAESNTSGGIGSAKNIRADLAMSSTCKANAKLAIRYVGK